MRLWIPGIAITLLLTSGAIGYYVWTHYEPPPDIHGAYLQPARKLANFTLLDHQQKTFAKQHLKGQWHLVTYGYTHCPDICPMTLSTLSQWVQQLKQESVYPDVRVLFYSVDGERDTPAVLNAYVPYFHPEFVGLTRGPQRSYQNFERSLGIVSLSSTKKGSREPGPWVDHGVMIMLVNPRAELQAVFKPERNEHGLLHFKETTLMRDYRAVRRFYARHGSDS